MAECSLALEAKQDRELLLWLAKEDASAFGECHGPSLDRLVIRGWASISGTTGHASVSLTETGLREARK